MALKNKIYHTMTIQESIEALKGNKDGLINKEANNRLFEYGNNVLDKVDKESILTLFLNQFKDFLILILIIAVFISALVEEFIDAIAILLILILNGLLGFYQEYQAEKSIEALQELTAPMAKVKRSGLIESIDATKVVPGDIFLLEAGDLIPADCRIIESFNLHIDESTFTGESLPVYKDGFIELSESTPVSDQINMLFMGTNVVMGTATAICVNTGMRTVMGNITEMLITAESRETPLKIKLNEFGVKLGWVILGICGLVVVIGVLASRSFAFDVILKMLIIGVALAVAAIPEGLPAVVTLALSIGVLRMSRQRAIVRKLRAVETLGSTTVICSDKTGTLTQNKMTVEKLILAPFDEDIIVVSDSSQEFEGIFLTQIEEFYPSQLHPEIQLLFKCAVCCNNSEVENTSSPTGDPTEIALLMAGLKADVHKHIAEKEWPRLMELPFDSNRKMMTTIHQTSFEEGNEKYVALIKGAPDVIREQCVHVQNGAEIVKLEDKLLDDLIQVEQRYADSALRVLAFAFRPLSKKAYQKFKAEKSPDYSIIENNLILLGIMAMRDPPRPEATQAIKVADQAGIRVMMITGDHKNTAIAIGEQMGIINSSDQNAVLTGHDLENLSQDELQNSVKDTKIFARVSPEHKLDIVHALQANHQIVAMTGDGVNDAPALKQADIGVAMGIAGTDVAKQASDMILIDDNFATLETAVEEGRSIFANMKKFIGYLLACNAGEVITIFLGIILLSFLAQSLLSSGNMTLEELMPLTALQLLYINLLTDGLPALALGVDPKESNIMNRPPRDPNEGIFNIHMISSILLAGTIVGVGTLILFFLNLNLSTGANHVKAQTIAFTVLIFFQKAMSLSSRSETESLFTVGIFANKFLWGAILLTTVIHMMVIYLEPLQKIFNTVELSVEDWLIILTMASTVFVAEELRKLYFRNKEKISN